MVSYVDNLHMYNRNLIFTILQHSKTILALLFLEYGEFILRDTPCPFLIRVTYYINNSDTIV